MGEAKVLTSDEKLMAISFRCKELGISYGRLMNGIQPQELNELYERYEIILKDRKKTEKERLAHAKAQKGARKKVNNEP